jgi:hypothetical protein
MVGRQAAGRSSRTTSERGRPKDRRSHAGNERGMRGAEINGLLPEAEGDDRVRFFQS